jgi:hypothetical protein
MFVDLFEINSVKILKFFRILIYVGNVHHIKVNGKLVAQLVEVANQACVIYFRLN